MTHLLIPCDPHNVGHPDRAFLGEYEAARRVGFRTILFHHDALWNGDLNTAFASIPHQPKATELIFRGWMMPEEMYTTLYNALRTRGWSMSTPPEAYAEAHYLPLGYRHIEGEAPRSVWMQGDDEERAWILYSEELHDRDAVMKDWVKSAKRRWRDACFLPSGTSRERFGEMFRIFRHERGRLFNRGVVFREFMPIVERGGDIRGLPIVDETRLFFWHNHLLAVPISGDTGPMRERARWEKIARRFASPFVTVDVARLVDNTWKVVEVGAGEVSGLPMGLDPMRFYASLLNRMVG